MITYLEKIKFRGFRGLKICPREKLRIVQSAKICPRKII